MPPTVILVTGPPGSGKTTLAHALGERVHCPVLSRDQVREGLLLGRPAVTAPVDGTMARRANQAFFEAVHLLLSHGVSLVVEAAFQHRVWVDQVDSLAQLADPKVIRCQVEPGLALERMRARLKESSWRQALHPDQALLQRIERNEADLSAFDAIHLEYPTLDVDTTHGYRPDLETLVNFVL